METSSLIASGGESTECCVTMVTVARGVVF